MRLEKENFNIISNNEIIINSIEIPAQEIEVLKLIQDFLDQLSKKEYEDFDGPVHPIVNIKEERQLLFQKEKDKINQNPSLSDEEKTILGFQARRKSEYETSKDIIEYKKEQLKKLLEFIENQEIWKTKFSTASNVNFSRTKHKNRQMFLNSLEESEENHRKLSFAGQNMNSIYFLSKNGMSLRVKVDSLFVDKGNIREALPIPQELFMCLDAMADDIYPKKHPEGIRFLLEKLEYFSFDPQIGFQVEEFCTREFLEHKKGNFKSKIQVTKDKDGIVIKNANGTHSGHCINKIFLLKKGNKN